MGIRKEKYLKLLKKKFGYTSFREKQFHIIDRLVHRKKDVCAIMPTGHGKSLCYQLPPLITKGVAFVISPLIALMEDQKVELQEKNISVCCLNSSEDFGYQTIEDIKMGKYRVVYMTPEFAINSQSLFEDTQDKLCMVAIDEAHTVSHWGMSFRPSYRELSCIKEWIEDVPILALTATATDKVLQDIIKVLQLETNKIYKTGFDRPNLYLSVKRKSSDIYDLEPLLFKKGKPIKDSVIIYCLTRKNTEKVAEKLIKLGVQCKAYHAGMPTSKRTTIHHEFIEGKINCIVATIAFGMGINKKDIRMVIHMNASKNIENYYQEIGRAGRDGNPAFCYLFYSDGDFGQHKRFAKDEEDDEYRIHCYQEIANMQQFVTSTICRRAVILNHFGENIKNPNCGNCDNCLTKKEIIDFSHEGLMLLKTVVQTGNTYGINMVADVLRGSKNQKVSPKLYKVSCYGKGKNKTVVWWKSLARNLINNGYLEEVPTKFGSIIQITEDGTDWMDLASMSLEGAPKLEFETCS